MRNILYHGALDPNGVQRGNIGDCYVQIVNHVFIRKWINVNGTITGWV